MVAANTYLLEAVNFCSLFVGLSLLVVLVRKRLTRVYWPVVGFLSVRILSQLLCMPPLYFRKELGLSKLVAYRIIFFSEWPVVVMETIFMVLVVFGVYSQVLQPFEPLRKLGTIVFRWITAVAAAVSLGVAIGPHMLGHEYALTVVSQIQQMSNVLTLCLLLFVCFGLGPLGLTKRSRYFGVCLGLGIMATVGLVQAAWIPAQHSLYSMVFFWKDLADVAGMLVWCVYFLLPEPKRSMVLLPTTSPYFLWNKISEMLGDAPGFVAIAGFKPENLAPAEMEALLASSDKPEDQAPRMLPQPQRAYGS